MRKPIGPPKICFIAGTLGRGGAERQLMYMLRALAQANVSTRVLCLTEGEPYESEIRTLGISVQWVGRARSRPARLCRIIAELRRERPDIVQSAHFYTNLYAAVAAKVLGLKDIGAIRCDLETELADNGVVGRWGLHSPGHIIANTAVACERAIAKGVPANRVHFVANVVDADWLTGDHRRSGRDEAVRILFAGRLTRQKRPDRFLRVVSRVVGNLRDGMVKGIVAGGGPMQAELEALSRELGLGPKHLEIVGEQDDIRSLYRRADMLMLTSDWEGTPNVILEAMACGLPVVATRVGDVSNIVGDNRGFVVEPNDENGLVDCALRLFKEPGLRQTLGASGREYVTRTHSLEILRDSLIDVYQKVLSQ
jgi:glycosyltransferase involved in cell wall biosynthesis